MNDTKSYVMTRLEKSHVSLDEALIAIGACTLPEKEKMRFEKDAIRIRKLLIKMKAKVDGTELISIF